VPPCQLILKKRVLRVLKALQALKALQRQRLNKFSPMKIGDDFICSI
jgi:CRISPR/Cas system-associated protein Cas7 (RAMP superfamily)